MSIVLPVIGSVLFLGATFFLSDYQEGSFSVYTDNRANHNPRITSFNKSADRFQVIRSSSDVSRFLSIEPRLAIFVKAEWASISQDAFLRNSLRSRENIVQIIVRLERLLTLERPPNDVVIDESWKKLNPKYVGTHYIYSLARGGDLTASIIFDTANETIKEKLNTAIEKNLGQSGDLPDDFEDRLKNIGKESGAMYNIESINCGACFNIFDGAILSISSITKFRNEFFTIFNQTGKDRGAPLYLELVPLSNLSSNYPTYSENSEVIAKLKDLEEIFDDIITAKKEIKKWGEYSNLYPEDYKKFGFTQFFNDVRQVDEVLHRTLIQLDVSRNSSVRQFDSLFKTYAHKENGFYTKRFEELKRKFEHRK